MNELNHKWEDEQRKQGLPDILQQWAESLLNDLLEEGEAARVRKICTDYLDKAS